MIHKTKTIAALVSFCVAFPIWLYLMHYVLAAVDASELAWFLYWIYVPAALVSGIVTRITLVDEKS